MDQEWKDRRAAIIKEALLVVRSDRVHMGESEWMSVEDGPILRVNPKQVEQANMAYVSVEERQKEAIEFLPPVCQLCAAGALLYAFLRTQRTTVGAAYDLAEHKRASADTLDHLLTDFQSHELGLISTAYEGSDSGTQCFTDLEPLDEAQTEAALEFYEVHLVDGSLPDLAEAIFKNMLAHDTEFRPDLDPEVAKRLEEARLEELNEEELPL